MGDSSAGIPVIDFSAYRLSLEKPDSSHFQKLVDDVYNALTTIGFFFVINTGFQMEKVQEMFRVSKAFFDLPVEVKLKYPRISAKGTHGYVSLAGENANPDRPYADLKECFNVNPLTDDDTVWPSELECPGFKTTMNDFFESCIPLHNRLLEIMAYGLKLEDPLFFVKHHSDKRTESGCTLRSLYYPSLKGVTVKEGQVRCGEHSDYGGITLLFQQNPGLEVCERGGSYIKVPLVDGGILVNIGDLMQRWTTDKYVAAKHRVLMDNRPEELEKCRQSVVFFGRPAYESVIECIDKSNKYPPVTCLEYLNMKFSNTYIY